MIRDYGTLAKAFCKLLLWHIIVIIIIIILILIVIVIIC